MINPVTPEQAAAALKQSQTALVELATRSLEAIERHVDLSLQAAKANLADATDAAAQLMSVKDPTELYSATQNLAQPLLGKAASFGRNVYNINAEAAADFSKLVEARIEEANKAFATSLNDLSKSAPAGTEGIVALMKSAFAASSSAFEAMNKATKQVAEMVESNVEAATKAGEAAVSSAPKASARRKAAAE